MDWSDPRLMPLCWVMMGGYLCVLVGSHVLTELQFRRRAREKAATAQENRPPGG